MMPRKLSDAQRRAIQRKMLLRRHLTNKALAARYGVSISLMDHIHRDMGLTRKPGGQR